MTLLESGLEQVFQGPQALQAWLDRNPDSLKPEFLTAVKQYALEARQQGAHNAALAAYLLAGSLYMRNGDVHGVLSSQLNQAEVMFFTAETTEAYEKAYSLSAKVADKALQESLADLVFWALGLAADSAYFASEVASNGAIRGRWLQIAIDALLKMEPLTPPMDETALWHRFVSSLVVIYQSIGEHQWGSETAAVEMKLHRLAALAERLIPLRFTFDDPEKTLHTARHLSELSKRYGSIPAAEARLKAIYQTGKSDKWIEP